MFTRWRAVLALPLILVSSGCQERLAPAERPLLDGQHEPDVLVESGELALPPAFDGNRFVSGWLPFATKRKLKGVVPAAAGARLEIVNLKSRPRALLVRTSIDQPEPSEIVLSHGDRELARQPLSGRVRFGLPADLPIGRVPLELRFSNTEGVMVKQAHASPALAAGEVRFQGDAILQSPWSSVDFVQEPPPGAVMLGTFEPPRTRGGEQAFAIAIQRQGSVLENVWEWSGSGPEELRIELPSDEGPVKVRLIASGAGEPGRWRNMRIAFEPEAEQPARVPDPPRVVILYLFDALRADYVGHLGGPADISPTLDRLASEGVSFEDHLSGAPNTKPSVKSLFIGRPFLLRGHEALPESGPSTLAQEFAAAGYRTFALSGSPWVSQSFGTDRGFEIRSARAEFRSSGSGAGAYNDSAERVHATAIQALDALGDDERAFLYLHTMHPHNPYKPPEPFLGRFTDGIDSTIDGGTSTLLSIRSGARPTTAADRDRLRGLYAGGLAYNDAQLELFLEQLDRRFEPGEVLLVLTSDHGEELFDHGGVLHGYTLYDEQLRVPLVFWWPGVLEPRSIEAGTEHLDLSATLRSLIAGAADPDTGSEADPGGDPEHGRPLWNLIADPSAGWSKPVRFAAASSVGGGIFMAQSADHKLVWAPRVGAAWGMGRGIGRSNDAEYLFDLRHDPEENVNLAGLGGLEYEWLRARLAAWIERGKLEEVGGAAEQVDEQTLERLRALGYVD